jgi:hypothetical protein
MGTDPNRCSECNGTLLYGPPLHCCWSQHGSEEPRDLYWCIECCEYISSASWNYEEWGPYQFTVTCNQAGHA